MIIFCGKLLITLVNRLIKGGLMYSELDIIVKINPDIVLYIIIIHYVLGMGTSSKFQTRVIEGIPRGSIEYSLNRIYF